MQVAWLGTGRLGAPMVERLLASGHDVVVWNRTRARAEALRDRGAAIADSAADAIRSAPCTLLMLTDHAAIEAVLQPEATQDALSGRTIVQMGTIAPAESRALAERIAAAGGDYLEAPVLGSIPQAADGSFIVMVGGSPLQFARWRDLLACFGPEPVHVGPVGTAATMKLALNQLIASLTAAFSYSLGLVQRGGVPVDMFMAALRQSALYAPTFDKKLDAMLRRDFSRPNFAAKHMAKDLRLIERTGRELGLDTGAIRALEAVLARALQIGHAESDYSALFEAIDPP